MLENESSSQAKRLQKMMQQIQGMKDKKDKDKKKNKYIPSFHSFLINSFISDLINFS